MQGGSAMNILILDDHPLVRCGIKNVLSVHETEIKIFESSTSEEAYRLLEKHEIHIMLVDLYLNNENGFDVIEKARKNYPFVRYVILTSSSKRQDIIRANQLNVSGYILKNAFVEDIIYALDKVNKGERFYSFECIRTTLNSQQDDGIESLTEREKEVFELISEGKNNSQIAQQLYISLGTVKKHSSNILSKLNLTNRIDIIMFAEKMKQGCY